MKRKDKVELIAKTIKDNHFGLPLDKKEYKWLAEHILDALKEAKRGGN